MLVVAALSADMLPCLNVVGSESPTDTQRAAAALADLSRHHRIVITHGGGPQLDLLSSHSELMRDARTYPLDVLGAPEESVPGALLERELAAMLPDREVVPLLAQVVVDALDPSFRAPSRPVGPVYREDDAKKLIADRGWTMAPVETGWRRVVASPAPRSVVEARTITVLLDAGAVVCCTIGGALAVVIDAEGCRHGVEAVVDEDWAAALLARQLDAETLLLFADVSIVEADHGTPRARPLRHTTPSELAACRAVDGSLGTKIDAACWFVSATGHTAAIGAVAEATSLLRGESGTIVGRGDH